jgi:predicted MFS family arabinose efflux permease
LLIGLLVRNPPVLAETGARGSLLDLLRLPALWPIIPMLTLNYIIAGGLRGLWIGPYFRDVHGLDATGIGWASLVMGLAMIAGSFAFGAADRLTGSRKLPVLAGTILAGLGCVVVALVPLPLGPAVTLVAALGFLGASYPLIFAHGRAFMPAHLTGRGVTLMNLFSIGGAGVFQYASARVHAASDGSFAALFLFFGLPLLAASALYALSRDNMA